MKNINETLLAVNEISKVYGNIKALDSVSLELKGGEIVAILGDNGSGKNTLVKILSGDLKPDNGSIYLNSELLKKLSSKKAIEKGISTVYQDLALDNYRNVPRNIFLGREPMKYFFIFDNKKMEKDTKELLNQIKINIPDLKIPVGYLSGGQRQSIAIARAMYGNNQFIILDEPTSAMGIKESHAFLKLVKQLPLTNKGILIISHNLEQIYKLADRVYIMRQGKLSKSYLLKDYSLDYIRKLLVGDDNYEEN